MCVYKIHHNILLLYLAKVEYGRTLIMIKYQSYNAKKRSATIYTECVCD